MSGQAGGRGYLVQAVIAVLDALDDGEWTECILEPQIGGDKVDLLLRYPSGDRVSQIKSSENAIGAVDVQRWAKELEDAYRTAKQFELRLIGPVRGDVASERRVGRVDIPPPEALNIKSLLERCAHRLDQYLSKLGHGGTRPESRLMLAEALATRLGQLAAHGKVLPREELNKLFVEWVAELRAPQDPAARPRFAASRLPNTGASLFGRENELATLFNAWNDRRTNVIEIVAPGGVGKTQLIKRWREELGIASEFMMRPEVTWQPPSGWDSIAVL